MELFTRSCIKFKSNSLNFTKFKEAFKEFAKKITIQDILSLVTFKVNILFTS